MCRCCNELPGRNARCVEPGWKRKTRQVGKLSGDLEDSIAVLPVRYLAYVLDRYGASDRDPSYMKQVRDFNCGILKRIVGTQQGPDVNA